VGHQGKVKSKNGSRLGSRLLLCSVFMMAGSAIGQTTSLPSVEEALIDASTWLDGAYR